MTAQQSDTDNPGDAKLDLLLAKFNALRAQREQLQRTSRPAERPPTPVIGAGLTSRQLHFLNNQIDSALNVVHGTAFTLHDSDGQNVRMTARTGDVLDPVNVSTVQRILASVLPTGRRINIFDTDSDQLLLALRT